MRHDRGYAIPGSGLTAGPGMTEKIAAPTDDGAGSDAPEPAQSAVWSADHAVGRRPEGGAALSPPARPRRGRSARHRPPLPSSDRRHRPARPPETEGRGPGHRRHGGGDRRPAPALAAATGRACPTRSMPATRPAISSSPSSMRAATISKSCSPSGRSATCPGRPGPTTACCRWCIPTAWSTKPVSPSCRWSSRSIR